MANQCEILGRAYLRLSGQGHSPKKSVENEESKYGPEVTINIIGKIRVV